MPIKLETRPTEHFGLKMQPGLLAQVKEMASELGVTPSALVRSAVRGAIRETGRDPVT
jgi:hypothetical protein